MATKLITQSDLVRFVALTRLAGYHPENKEEYRKLGRRILEEIVIRLGLKKGEYDIRWNPGGIAVSGDHTLHTDTLYLALHDNCGLGSFYFRVCKSRKDLVGGPNHNYRWHTLITYGLERLIKMLTVAHTGKYTNSLSGDQLMDAETAIKLVEIDLDQRLSVA